MDAITSAVVARYFESGLFAPMGIPSEAQLIVPKVQPLEFDSSPVICLAGKTGAGKSVVARYLSVFYGFSWIRTRDIVRNLLLKDITTPPGKRLFQRTINPEQVSETDLRDFGALILDVYKQRPLREMLNDVIQQAPGPVVVDSIRDISDVSQDDSGQRPIVTWFVDCSDSIIQQRLVAKTKFGEKRIQMASPVDHTASALKREVHTVISNSGSLEELRWHVDDALFEITVLATTETD
jgi:dephospho-CoA kinase